MSQKRKEFARPPSSQPVDDWFLEDLSPQPKVIKKQHVLGDREYCSIFYVYNNNNKYFVVFYLFFVDYRVDPVIIAGLRRASRFKVGTIRGRSMP